MSEIFEFNDKYNYARNDCDENIINQIEYPKRTLLRTKGLPEKLEKHLNNEKERELEYLYEENRQLLMEISKLRKTNQLLVKDVNKKNEIIDNLDSNLMEVEEKLENVKKKNWNMYNEILNKERKFLLNKENNINEGNNKKSDIFNMEASNIGNFNTVDIKSNTAKPNVDQRPKSTSVSVSTENRKLLEDIILESLNEKAEKKAYDNLKYEVEKLQKEVYSMQSDLLKCNNQNTDHLINNVFQSNNSISSISNINKNSLAEELKEADLSSNQKNLDQSNEIDKNESIPPRSVHILMGKTFSKNNKIDKKLHQYRNNSNYNYLNRELQPSINNDDLNTSIKENYYYLNKNFLTNNYSNIKNNFIQNEYQFYNNCSINEHFMSENTESSSGKPLIFNSANQETFSNSGITNSIPITIPSAFSTSLNTPIPNFVPRIIPRRSIPSSLSTNMQTKIINDLPLPFQNLSLKNPTLTPINPINSAPRMPFPPFKIKIIQKFRRTRNHSLPPKINELNFNSEDKDLPQGYIRFKTSITSPVTPDDQFSPPSISGMCPCEKTYTSRGLSKARSRIASNTIHNQFIGSRGLLKFK